MSAQSASAPAAVARTGGERERTFLIEELFFSTTDRKGVIRSGNDVFVRVSAYSEAELVGSPHNLIRHPDMPRAVFQLLWDEILAGRPIAAYVKNRAKDGAFYWVMAVVVPAGDDFLSVRLKPTSPLFGAVDGLYAELRQLELSIESGEGKARKRAIAASSELLGQRLGELGFADYQAFMRVALAAELAAREEALGERARPAEPADGQLLESVRDGVGSVLRFLDRQFADLNGYVELDADLSRRSGFVAELAASIRLFSLNALIGATRLGSSGAALGAVAHLMGVASVRVTAILRDLTAAISGTVDQLSELVFAISVCKLQAEMTVEFARELLRSAVEEGDASHDARVRNDVGLLIRSVNDELRSIAGSLDALHARLHDVSGAGARLTRELSGLRALQVNGRIEAAAFGGTDARGVEALFARIRAELDEAARETEGLETTVHRAAQAQTGEEAVGHIARLDGLGTRLAA